MKKDLISMVQIATIMAHETLCKYDDIMGNNFKLPVWEDLSFDEQKALLELTDKLIFSDTISNSLGHLYDAIYLPTHLEQGWKYDQQFSWKHKTSPFITSAIQLSEEGRKRFAVWFTGCVGVTLDTDNAVWGLIASKEPAASELGESPETDLDEAVRVAEALNGGEPVPPNGTVIEGAAQGAPATEGSEAPQVGMAPAEDPIADASASQAPLVDEVPPVEKTPKKSKKK